ncbi:energy transducer TonB family protein [Bradyrhizobium valentinum]|uniref:energy transducer TonB family protein n=1 Tax=Bradyrhizobium valentinum TaxID=1518501 RepID=UPI00070B93BE|nr:TonB family protein [Bradyrhizobium valentinum]KRR00181.1 energy transducer TonB [Bradyrhizobium valentinum]
MIDWRDPDGRPERNLTALSALRWTAAVIVVVATHGGGAWLALNWKPATAAGEPPSAVMIELAPLAVSPEAPPQDVAPGLQMTEAQTEPTPDEPEKPVEKPEEVQEPVPQEVVEKLPENENAEAVLTPPPPEPPKPEPVKKSPPKVKTVEKNKPIDPKKTRAPQTTAPPTSQAQRSDRAAAAHASASFDPSMSPASWRSALMAHLNRHKRPAAAAGTVVTMVAFTIDRSGRVLSSRLVRSSGDSALDAEAVSLPRRASPVPTPPPDVGGGSVTLAVPIRFNR